MKHLIENRSYCQGSNTKPGYISDDIKDLKEISSRQRYSALQAIFWLIAKVPQSVEEIAEHFGMSPSLVESLLKELLQEQLIIRAITKRYRLNTR